MKYMFEWYCYPLKADVFYIIYFTAAKFAFYQVVTPIF